MSGPDSAFHLLLSYHVFEEISHMIHFYHTGKADLACWLLIEGVLRCSCLGGPSGLTGMVCVL
jgi:hypothetical protein